MKVSIEMNKELYPQIPDFSKWSEDQLNQYSIAWFNDFRNEYKLECFEEEEALLKKWLNKNLMTQQEYDLIINADKELWQQTNAFMSIPANEGGCIVFIDTEKKFSSSGSSA